MNNLRLQNYKNENTDQYTKKVFQRPWTDS